MKYKVFTLPLLLVFLILSSTGPYASSENDVSGYFAGDTYEEGLLPIPGPLKNTNIGSTPYEKFLNLLKDLSPDSYFIVSEVKNLLGITGLEDYINNDNFYMFDNNIHNLCDTYNMAKVYWYNDRRCYFLGDMETKIIQMLKCFRSDEIASSIPQNLRTLRFDPTIYPYNKSLDSQVNGIYGLLEEFNAYYIGCRAGYASYSYYKTYPDKTNFNTFQYDMQTWAAYYECKFFILKYMLYAKKNYPDIYNALIKDNNLKYIYTTLNRKYSNLVGSYLRLMQQELNVCSPYGSEIADLLKPELEKQEYIDIEKGLLLESAVNPSSSISPVMSYKPTPTAQKYKIYGYISTDFTSNTSTKSGFRISINGTQKSVITDEKGYFVLYDVPLSASGYTLLITKEGYLSRSLNICLTNDIQAGTQTKPVTMWAGDITQDNVINMADIIELSKYFNRTLSQSDPISAIDINKDNAINFYDILIIARHFNAIPSNYPKELF